MRPAFELGDSPITTSVVVPRCRTTEPSAPFFDDGLPRAGTDLSGDARYACVFVPPGTSPASPRPLVVFLHGGGGGAASDVYDFTTLRQKAASFPLSGDPARTGFVLAAVQGRSLHYPTNSDRDGHHHDFYFRDLSSPSRNPDVANLDRLIDELAADGSVDPRRIYLTGWSNGGFFSQMYGIARHDVASPGGHRVAAVSVFTAADPFHNINDVQVPSCQIDPYPRSALPIMVTSRSCDLVACDAAQAEILRAQGLKVEPGHVVGPWIDDLRLKVGNSNVRRLIVGGNGASVGGCTGSTCSPQIGLLNHLRWPNGVADRSGVDHEPEMLGFLRDHPLPAAGTAASVVVPVVLDVAGVPPTHYSSDLVAVNRSPISTRVSLQLIAGPGAPGNGSAAVLETVGPGRELRIADVIRYLRDKGVSLPPAGTSVVGSLRVTFLDVTDPALVFSGSRTSTPNPSPSVGGSFGLFVSGTQMEAIPTESRVVYGLRDDAAFRSNLAIVDVPVGTGPPKLSIQVWDGDLGSPAGTPVAVALGSGEWMQLNGILASKGIRNGWAIVTRTGGGSDPFLVYGVVNDGASSGGGTSDGSLMGSEASEGLVPIVLRVSSGSVTFTSELVLANPAAAPADVRLTYTPAPSLAAGAPVTAQMTVPAGRQLRLPDVVSSLGDLGLPIPSATNQGGTLLVEGNVAALVRTSNPNPDTATGGTFGVAYGAFPAGARGTTEAWVYGLLQDAEARSNLAIADARVGNASRVGYLVDIYDSVSGAGFPATTLGPYSLAGGEWFQLSGVLSKAGLSRGYARVRPQSGQSDFVAYGVVNDGASPGEGTSDGSYIAPRFGSGPPQLPAGMWGRLSLLVTQPARARRISMGKFLSPR
jgi:dienelactone hydrolase